MPIAESGAVLKLRRSRGWCARTGLEVSACIFHHSLSDARMRPLNLGACLLGMPSVLHAASPRSTKPLFTARRLPRDAEKHAFRAFAGGRISQKKIKAPFESVVCSTAILGVGSTRLHPSSSDATLPDRSHAWCKKGCPAPAVAAFPPGDNGLDAKTRPLLRLLQ